MDSFMEGPLSKWTNVMKGWQYRWFVLDDNSGILSYYTSRDKMVRGSRRGCVRLRGANIGIDDDDDSTFTITVDHKIFHFQARDCDERIKWISALEDTIMRHSRIRSQHPGNISIEDFDNKLSEADAYLKLLIEQVKAIEVKINNIEDPNEHHKYSDILVVSRESIEAVKQSIVLLQMSKDSFTLHQKPALSNTAEATQRTVIHQNNMPSVQTKLPTNNYDTASYLSESSSFQSLDKMDAAVPMQQIVANGDNKTTMTNQDNHEAISNGVTSETNAVDPPSLPLPTTGAYPPPSPLAQSLHTNVPVTSYSSSEDENDEFFDADEIVITKSIGQTMPSSKSECVLSSPTALDDIGVTIEPEQVTHDDLYMDEDDHTDIKEGESVEEHKSVIMHLLSQVKLGMDLTKVVLPTFILERRSLLEMYADFFAHPQLYANIADQPNAESRMIECLRWYLSAFHAGRKGSVAKKPYNPILGEQFQCFWNLPDMEPDEYKVNDGPVPWGHRNNVTFLAEQVSHHPPVSAFYCEHYNKRIQFNGHIWTKSKFLGLSIGVHNIGQGCVRLLDLEEEYIMMFPNGYGRSILTVPWVELGGTCSITCEKTGYTSNITFHTKPFYGGKVHRISAEVLCPGAKKPILTVEGEWNGIMTAKWTKTGKTEVFIDTKKIKVIKKCVRKLELQERKESRQLWKEVTHNLRVNNIDKATEHKRALEEEQRNDAKQRAENAIKYNTRDFKEDDNGNWVYNNPLINRL